MQTALIKVFMALNRFALQASRGRIGSRLTTQTVLLLHTVGRKTGRPRVTPIAYFYLEGFYFVVGSNWGKDANADWYANLLAHPQTMIEVKGRRIPVVAHPAEGPEYERLWKYATEHHPPYLRYQTMTRRHIPIVVLQPIND